MNATDALVVGHLRIPRAEFTFTFATSGGSGGQNVNKVNSKAVLRWDVVRSPSVPAEVRARFLSSFGNRVTQDGELVLMSDVHRDQPRNVEDCLAKVQGMLQSVLVAPKKRRPTRPGRGAVKRRLATKSAQSDKKRERSRRGDD
jgi:ribosome-associated protein